jgi:two-component system invasion response regulator UvrY
MYRVVLVDDRALIRDSLRALLTATGRVSVEAIATVTELEASVGGALPDAILIDYPVGVGLAAAESPLAARLILLHVPPLAAAAGFAAAAGWLSRRAELAEVLDAIEAVAAGGRFVSRDLTATGPAAGAVSRRELEVMRALAAGRTNHEIAADLGISVKTVDTHRGHVLKKLALRNNAELTRFAIAS